MFIISNKQLQHLTSGSLQQFEAEMVLHIKEYFPDHFRTAGEDAVRKTIRYGYARARQYDFTSKRNVCLHLNNMLLFGSNYDQDPQYPWAQEILKDTSLADPKEKSDKLSDEALRCSEQINGDDNRHALRMLLHLADNGNDLYGKLVSASLNTALSWLKDISPQKYQVVGEDNLRKFVLAGTENAARYGIRPQSGALIFIVCMYVLGSGFDRDPLFPWAADILVDTNLPGQRAALLYQKMIGQIRKFLSGYNNKEKPYV